MSNIYYTVSDLAAIEINGKLNSYPAIRRVIAKANVQPKGKGIKGADTYDLAEIQAAFKTHGKRISAKGTQELSELKIQKLQEDIAKSQLEQERLNQEKERAQLELRELKRKLIDADEVRNYIQMRMGVELSILRRILFVNAPIEIPGEEIVKARIKCEDYFNQICAVLQETLSLWEQSNCEDGINKPIPNNIQKVIDELDRALKEKNESTK